MNVIFNKKSVHAVSKTLKKMQSKHWRRLSIHMARFYPSFYRQHVLTLHMIHDSHKRGCWEQWLGENQSKFPLFCLAKHMMNEVHNSEIMKFKYYKYIRLMGRP